MLDAPSWMKLIDGLVRFTAAGKVRWEEKSSASAGAGISSTMARAVLNSINQPRIFGATAGGAVYEISSSDAYGGAPYELRVWEFEGTKMHPVGAVKSSTNVADSVQFELNAALKRLFVTVDESTETSGQIVDRLLRGLGDDV